MGWPVVLERALRTRRQFDPTVSEDVAELRYYIENGRWRNGCPFMLEGTYVDIPYQCLFKWAKHSLMQTDTV